MKKSLIAAVCVFVSVMASSLAAEEISTQDGAHTMMQVRDTCKMYTDNGAKFWRGDFKKVEDAPGLVLLNKEIQRSIRKASSVDRAKEISWQKCLDVVFNDNESKKY